MNQNLNDFYQYNPGQEKYYLIKRTYKDKKFHNINKLVKSVIFIPARCDTSTLLEKPLIDIMAEAKKNQHTNALKEVKRLCKGFGFTGEIIKSSLAEG